VNKSRINIFFLSGAMTAFYYICPKQYFMKWMSTKYSAASFNVAMLLLRVGMGVLLFPHGYRKLVEFSARKDTFMNFLGLGSTTSLILIIFAEVVCSVLIVLGLFTRFAAIPPLIGMLVVVFVSYNGDVFGKGELAALYAVGYTVLLLVGPGKASMDAMMKK
jgi:putative oxidoreductase